MKNNFTSFCRFNLFRAIAACLLIIVIFCSYNNVFAADNVSIGYFGSTHLESGRPATVVLPPYSPEYAEALPADKINSKQTLYDFLVTTNQITDPQKTDPQKITGSAYIICTMLGKANAQDCIDSGYIKNDRSVFSQDIWDLLKKRLVDNPDIVFRSFDITFTEKFRNTMWDPEENDVYAYDKKNSPPRSTIVLGNAEGTFDYYKIFRSCANPTGGLSGLPSTWSAEPGVRLYINHSAVSELDSKSAQPDPKAVGVGDDVGWHNIVKFNNGSSSVKYDGHITTSNPLGIGDVWNQTIAGKTVSEYTDVPLFSNMNGNSDKKIEPKDVAKTFCMWTSILPSAYNNSGETNSKQSCVYVTPNWKITATTGVTVNGQGGKTQAKPGDTIVWDHKVKNDGPTYTTDFITSWLKVAGITNWSKQSEGQTAGGKDLGVIRTITDFATYEVKPGDVGKTLCEQVEYTRNDNGASGYGDNVCIYIPYQYTLVPRITLNPSGVLEDGSSFTVNPSVENQGSTQSQETKWSLIERIYYPNGSNRSSTSLGSGSNVIFNPQSTTYTPSQNMPVVASGEVGTKYCYTLTATPRSDSDNGPVEFGPTCITIGKKPKVQVWGGNTISGGLISTSLSNKAGNLFGSWTEYGVFANSSITGMASGSAFSRPTGLPNPATAACGYSRLSFTNVPLNASTCSGAVNTIGNYGTINKVLANLSASFPGNSKITVDNVNNMIATPGVFIGSSAEDITLSGSTLAAGKTVILKVSGTVTITDNQFYKDIQYMNSSQLPQLIIIANNINIQDNVKNIDAWLVASDNINTCANIVGNLSASLCASQLIVNGPVSTDSLMLRRTAGSGTGNNSGDPAEIFNLRADTFLWAENFAKNNPKAQSVYLTELPPRF